MVRKTDPSLNYIDYRTLCHATKEELSCCLQKAANNSVFGNVDFESYDKRFEQIKKWLLDTEWPDRENVFKQMKNQFEAMLLAQDEELAGVKIEPETENSKMISAKETMDFTTYDKDFVELKKLLKKLPEKEKLDRINEMKKDIQEYIQILNETLNLQDEEEDYSLKGLDEIYRQWKEKVNQVFTKEDEELWIFAFDMIVSRNLRYLKTDLEFGDWD